MADAGSVGITRQPQGLISALKKLARDKEPLEVANKATAHLFIVNPFKNKTRTGVGFMASLFNTHPPLSERIKALEEMN
jgi:heat shock protein HtpX